VLAVGVAGWVVLQLVLPLRHFAYPGDYRWPGQGYRVSWNVLLTAKSGSVTFEDTEPSTGRTWIAEPGLLYTENQLRVMSSEPDLIHQAARTIAADERGRGHDVEVRVDAWMSLNGRPATRLIDPTVDLAAEPLDPWPDAWILPARHHLLIPPVLPATAGVKARRRSPGRDGQAAAAPSGERSGAIARDRRPHARHRPPTGMG
jgi:hypothetical protein